MTKRPEVPFRLEHAERLEEVAQDLDLAALAVHGAIAILGGSGPPGLGQAAEMAYDAASTLRALRDDLWPRPEAEAEEERP